MKFSPKFQLIRQCTATGRPCGGEALVKEMEEKLNRDFTRKKRGPKPKVIPDQNPLLNWTDDQIIR
jgi:hypothetical protein